MELTMDQLKEVVAGIMKEVNPHGMAPDVPGEIKLGTADPIVDAITEKDVSRDITGMSAKERRLAIGRTVRALAATKGNAFAADKYAEKVWNESPDSHVRKILVIGTDASGGFLIPEILSDDFIELYRPVAVVRNQNPVEIPMPEGNMSMNGLASGASADYIGETENLPVGEQTFRRMSFSAKKLAVLTPISNDLLSTPSGKVDRLVADDISYATASREDIAFLRGDGSGNSPVGFKSLCLPANLIPSAWMAGTSLGDIRRDIYKLKKALRYAEVPFRLPVLFMSPRSEFAAELAMDSYGNTPLGTEMQTKGTLMGFPFVSTTKIPDNLGAGSDESEIYLVDMADVVVADMTRPQIAASMEASYFDGTQMRSAFHADLTLMRIIARHDFNMRHLESLAILTGVKWDV